MSQIRSDRIGSDRYMYAYMYICIYVYVVYVVYLCVCLSMKIYENIGIYMCSYCVYDLVYMFMIYNISYFDYIYVRVCVYMYICVCVYRLTSQRPG